MSAVAVVVAGAVDTAAGAARETYAAPVLAGGLAGVVVGKQFTGSGHDSDST